MRVLILGSGGMAGHIIYDNFKNLSHFNVFNAAREKVNPDTILFDAADKISVKNILEKTRPDVVINAVGLLVKDSNTNPANAVLINSYFPHLLSQLTGEIGAYTIHLSTDCVFSGHKGNYLVDDVKDATDFYGQSKGLGELNNGNDLTIRTSIIGPEIKAEGTGLFHWYVKTSGNIMGFTKVFWSGVTTLELVRIIEKSILLKEKGLLQISNNEKISKFELLRLIGKYFNKDVELIGKEEKTEHDKSLICSAPSERYAIPGYETMVKELKKYVEKNKDLYFTNYPVVF